jgi:hypothetical protein
MITKNFLDTLDEEELSLIYFLCQNVLQQLNCNVNMDLIKCFKSRWLEAILPQCKSHLQDDKQHVADSILKKLADQK